MRESIGNYWGRLKTRIQSYWDRFKTTRFYKWWTLPRALGALALILGLFGTARGPIPYIPGITPFYWAIGPELIGIGVTVLIIDYAYEQRQQNQLREQLRRDLLSGVRDFAVRAVDELRHYEWLDPTLKDVKYLLRGTHLAGANLQGTHLEGADLQNAHLEGTFLQGTHLEGANLRWANMKEAILSKAHLEEASLWGVHLEGAILWGTHLEGADLQRAHLENADLVGTSLENANLQRAHLEGANLVGVHLEGANLQGTHLKETNLKRAHLQDAKGIFPKDITSTHSLYGTTMPDGSTPKEWAFRLWEEGEIDEETFNKIVQLAKDPRIKEEEE